MKTFIKSLALALSLGVVVSTASFAEANPGGRPTAAASYKSGVYTNHAGKMNVAIDKQTGGAVDVRLTNTHGDILYSYHLGKNAKTFRTCLNLSELEDGVYQLEITNGAETTTQTVTVSTQEPSTPNRVVTIN